MQQNVPPLLLKLSVFKWQTKKVWSKVSGMIVKVVQVNVQRYKQHQSVFYANVWYDRLWYDLSMTFYVSWFTSLQVQGRLRSRKGRAMWRSEKAQKLTRKYARDKFLWTKIIWAFYVNKTNGSWNFIKQNIGKSLVYSFTHLTSTRLTLVLKILITLLAKNIFYQSCHGGYM